MVSVISRGGSLGLVGEERVKSNPVTSPATELQWDLGQGYLGPQWAQVGGKKTQSVISMLDGTCLQEAEIWEGGCIQKGLCWEVLRMLLSVFR